MNNKNITSSPSFNASFVQRNATREKKVGKTIAAAAKEVKPQLKKLAEKFDVYVIPYKFGYYERGLAVKVTMPTKNPIKHFLNKLDIKYQVWNNHIGCGISDWVNRVPLFSYEYEKTIENMKNDLIEVAEELAEKVADMKGLSYWEM